jgi:hypothetical protein
VCLGLHGQARLDSPWPAGIYTRMLLRSVPRSRISRDTPTVADLNFSLANGEVLVVEVPRHALERVLVRARRAIEAAPLLARGRSCDHSAAHPQCARKSPERFS